MKTCLMIFLVASLAATANAHDPQQGGDLSDLDQIQIAIQKICPVMGAELGSMGQPLKVHFGDEVAFLCCKGCIGKPVDPQHWQTIQNNIARAQGTCPVMDKPVTGDMESTIVDGQKVFVCCPPCIDKIQDNPKANLAKVNSSRASFVRTELLAKSEELHIAVQAICAVSGQTLGSMGPPVKVQVGEEHAFLCCKSCTSKKISAEHWKTIQANLAKAQAICPVMGHEIPKGARSTVVNGRKIFVCCPPCIDKIKAEPEKYIAKLNQQYAKFVRSRGQQQAHLRNDETLNK